MQKTKRLRNIFLIAGLMLFSFMIYKIGIDVIAKNIAQTGWWFIAIIGIWIPIYLFNSLSWYSIIKDGKEEHKVSFWRVMKLTISGYALNYVSPGGLVGGEPYRIMELRKSIGTHKATSSVISYAMMHFLSHFFFWLMNIPLILFLIPTQKGLTTSLIIVFVVCSILIFLLFKSYKKGLIVKILHFFYKVPFLRKKVRRFILTKGESLHVIDEQIAELLNEHPKAFYSSLIYDFVARLLSAFEVLFILTALGQDVTFFDCIIIIGISSLFANIFFFSPMQLGTREAGFALALSSLSLPLGLGVSVSLITRIRELAWILIGLILIKVNPGKEQEDPSHLSCEEKLKNQKNAQPQPIESNIPKFEEETA